jgi:DNA-binding transcriptional ArsR family regulator
MSTVSMTGDELLRVLGTLANPHRLRVVAALAEERNYVSQLARELGISRALLQVHLRKLEAAGLVSADIEVSADGKAMKFYEVTPFAVLLTPEVIEAATRTLTAADLPAPAERNAVNLGISGGDLGVPVDVVGVHRVGRVAPALPRRGGRRGIVPAARYQHRCFRALSSPALVPPCAGQTGPSAGTGYGGAICPYWYETVCRCPSVNACRW